MKKNPLITICFIVVVFLILNSFLNVVGYQTIQSTNQNAVNEEVNQRELLFQTIVDIANNKEIQRIIFKSQMSGGIFRNPDVKFSLSKNLLKQMYFMGLILSKTISKSRMLSMIGKYQSNNQEIQTKISTVIQKDVTLNGEINQLSILKCDCENDNTFWHFPVICTILTIICFISGVLTAMSIFWFDNYFLTNFFGSIWEIAITLKVILVCLI